MEIKMTLNELLGINHTLRQIIDDDKKEIEPLLKFRMLGIMKSIEPHVINFEAVRNETVARYGEKSEDGTVRIAAENTEAIDSFNKELSTLLSSEVAVNINKLKPEDIFNRGVSSEYLIGLYTIIEA